MTGSFAHLIADSPFRAVFPNGMAPIRGIIGSRVLLQDAAETTAYLLDLKRCSGEQMNQLAEILSARSGVDAAQILADIARDGLPIRESQVSSVATDLRYFL